MNSDIRLAVTWRNHHKRVKLQRRLGPEGVLSFIDLMLAVAQNKPDGLLCGWDNEDIALSAGWTGDADLFVETLIQVRLVDRDGDGRCSIHDWEEHNAFAAAARTRSEKARKAAKAKWERRLGAKEQCSSNAQAMLKHSSSDANSFLSNAPSPNPSPSPSPTLRNTTSSCSGEANYVRPTEPLDLNPCPHKKIIELYHVVLPELPKIRTWPEHRKKALKTRWNEDSSRQSLDWWRGFFLEKVKPSDFLCGRVNEWTASLDWIILPRNFAKVLDGFYVRDVKKNGTNGHHTETEAEREARLERYRSYANA